MKRVNQVIMGKTAAAVLAAAALTLSGCGGASGQAPVSEEPAQESAAAETPVKEEEAQAEAPVEADTVQEAQAGTEANTQEQMPVRPQPSDETPSDHAQTGASQEQTADEQAKDAPDAAPAAGSEWLDGAFVFDGMELQLPIQMTDYKLGGWTITFEDIDDLTQVIVKPDEIYTAVMTSKDFTEDDIKATAEFGNYGEEPVALSDLPMTGIYLQRGKGKVKEDGEVEEPKLPEVVLPEDFTWGKSAEDMWAAFGEPSFSGITREDFDGMYENGRYYMELAGMTDIGIDHIIYCVE